MEQDVPREGHAGGHAAPSVIGALSSGTCGFGCPSSVADSTGDDMEYARASNHDRTSHFKSMHLGLSGDDTHVLRAR